MAAQFISDAAVVRERWNVYCREPLSKLNGRGVQVSIRPAVTGGEEVAVIKTPREILVFTAEASQRLAGPAFGYRSVQMPVVRAQTLRTLREALAVMRDGLTSGFDEGEVEKAGSLIDRAEEDITRAAFDSGEVFLKPLIASPLDGKLSRHLLLLMPG